MSLEWIKEPVSGDAPGGPDLWEEDDPEFSEYYFDALGRLPEADDYVKLGLAMGGGSKAPDVIFDPKSVDLAEELGQIDGLLKRTRDLRLLTLRAQWAALAGDMEQAADSVSAMADLIETLPEAAHPMIDGSPRDRLEAINDLSSTGAMILPLRYYDIADSGASRRRMMVVKGDVTPHDGEDDLSLDSMVSALAGRPEDMAQDHAALTRFREAIGRIEVACLSHPTPHTPQLKTLTKEIDAVLDVIGLADPDLASSEADEPEGESAAPVPGAAVAAGPAPVVTEVKDHDEARRRLVAVETYFGRKEPSSAAVLLVTQARLLIGKSLVDAFDILMPNTADRAKVEFISDNGFQLAHQQLRNLADQVLIEEVEEPEPEPEPATPPPPEPEPEPVSEDASEADAGTANPVEGESVEGDGATEGDAENSDEAEAPAPEPEPVPEPVTALPPPAAPAQPEVFIVRDPAAAGAQITAVENYFRAVEKSSPIPLLLQRARSYIGKDFESLLKEFVPKQDY